MSLETVHINPVAPDPNASGRYGSSEQRAQSERNAPPEVEEAEDDRIEISENARVSFALSAAPPDMDFARKALNKLPSAPAERSEQLAARIETGYYRSPVVVRQVATRLTSQPSPEPAAAAT